MPNENRFEGIGEQIDDGDEDETTDEAAETTDKAEPVQEPAGEDDEDGPAFSFEQTAQTSIYPRSETADNVLDDVEFEVESVLRREHDIRDLAGRELHDAMIRLAKEHPDEVAALIVDARDE